MNPKILTVAPGDASCLHPQRLNPESGSDSPKVTEPLLNGRTGTSDCPTSKAVELASRQPAFHTPRPAAVGGHPCASVFRTGRGERSCLLWP